MYSKGNSQKKKDLLYKTYKSDPKLVKTTLEMQNFRYTDTHD
jgi:hypothetical protein